MDLLRRAFEEWEFVPDPLDYDSVLTLSEKWFIDLDVDSLSFEEAKANAEILIGLIPKEYFIPEKARILLQSEIEDYYRKELTTLRNKDPFDKWETDLNKIIARYILDKDYQALDFYH